MYSVIHVAALPNRGGHTGLRFCMSRPKMNEAQTEKMDLAVQASLKGR